jgi:outer membrane protein OmpA-like peptidoglycan-associated protein
VALVQTPDARAGLMDAIKKKAAEKVSKKAETVVDRAADEKPAAEAEPAAAETVPAKSGSGGTVSTVSTKFDFVPGDSVIFFDDFSKDELGEFPARWRLARGTFEVAELEGEHWLRCTSVDGTVRMKLPAMSALPEFWTLEFDFYATEPMASALTVRALTAGESVAWEAVFPQGSDLAFRSGDIFASTPVEAGVVVPGRHHVMFMARGSALKAYIDRQRMANVPDVIATAGAPRELEIRLWASTQPMITHVRFAEGCQPAADMLAAGTLITYGIRFASGSDVVLPESAPVLRQVAGYMTSTPAVKLRISGHTDDVGTPADNLDLSKRRAASVAKVLTADFGIAGERLATGGHGDTQPLSKSANAEGRAMNRRVEFAKWN